MKVVIAIPDKLIVDTLAGEMGNIHEAVCWGVKDAIGSLESEIRLKMRERMRSAIWAAFTETLDRVFDEKLKTPSPSKSPK